MTTFGGDPDKDMQITQENIRKPIKRIQASPDGPTHRIAPHSKFRHVLGDPASRFTGVHDARLLRQRSE
eukprot:4508458-Pyramimonas_sp.AAC.1